jgi:hypothetical protein
MNHLSDVLNEVKQPLGLLLEEAKEALSCESNIDTKEIFILCVYVQ